MWVLTNQTHRDDDKGSRLTRLNPFDLSVDALISRHISVFD